MTPIKARLFYFLVGLATILLSLSIVQAQTGLTFDVTRQGTTATYSAISRTGSFRYTGSLKSVVQSAVSRVNAAGGGSIIFAAGDFDLGADYFLLHGIANITFAGQGIDITIIRNFSDVEADTEPFNCANCDRLTIRDMTVSAGGAIRLTSDTLDFDDGDYNLIERIKVTSSRGRAIIFDGKGVDGHADNNIVRDCIITGNIPFDGIQLLASNGNRVEGCTITGVQRHGIFITRASAIAPQPNKSSDDNLIINNQISNVLGRGISISTGSRNVIRANTITNGNQSGIHLATSTGLLCDNNLIEANISTANLERGLHIASAECRYTVVKDNRFTGNGLGAILDQGTGTIYQTSPTATPTASPTRTPTPLPYGTTITLTAIKDSYVDASNPSINHGTSATLRTDAQPITRTYITFNVPSYTGTVMSASLRVYANSANSIGYRVYGSSNTWNETSITYSNAPAFSTLLGSSGAISANSWTQVNVTSRITGSGQYTFVLDSTSSTGTSFSSRTGARPPQLVIVLSGN